MNGAVYITWLQQIQWGFLLTTISGNKNGFFTINWSNGTAVYYYSKVNGISNPVIGLVFDNVAFTNCTLSITNNTATTFEVRATTSTTVDVYWSYVNLGIP
jgi:hypothetical protein